MEEEKEMEREQDTSKNSHSKFYKTTDGFILTDFTIDIERIPLFQQNNNERDYWQPWVNIKREVSGSWTTHFDPLFYSLIFPPSHREKIQEPSKYLSKEVMFYLDKTKHQEEKSLQQWKEEWGLDC